MKKKLLALTIMAGASLGASFSSFADAVVYFARYDERGFAGDLRLRAQSGACRCTGV